MHMHRNERKEFAFSNSFFRCHGQICEVIPRALLHQDILSNSEHVMW